MHRLIVYPLQNVGAQSLRGVVSLRARMEFTEDGAMITHLGIVTQRPAITLHRIPEGCTPSGYRLVTAECGYFLAGEFLAKCLAIAPGRDWDSAIAAFLKQLPAETVVIYEAT